MAEVNKINLKSLKENYMRKPEEEKEEDAPIETTSTENSWNNNTSGSSSWTENIVNTEKDKKLDDKELFSKYESFFKREGEQLNKKLQKKEWKKCCVKTKKHFVNFFAGLALLQLIIIPGYFIISWWSLESLKASIFESEDKVVEKEKVDENPKVIEEEDKDEEIIKEKEKINIWWYIFDVDTEVNKSWVKTFIYEWKKYKSKLDLRKWLEKEIKKLKREKLIELLLEEKKIQEELIKEEELNVDKEELPEEVVELDEKETELQQWEVKEEVPEKDEELPEEETETKIDINNET